MFGCVGKRMGRAVVCCAMLLVLAAAWGGAALFQWAWPAAISAQKYEWGLSFQGGEGEPPVPNLSAGQLAQHSAYYCGSASRKRLYLTFDCGYENGNMPAILDALKKHNAPGAFFVVATYIEENPDLVRRMAAEGHTVGNHSNHHPDMTTQSKEQFTQELQSTEALYYQTTGQQMPKFYRPPEGKFSDENLAWAEELGYRTIFWSLAYVDWSQESQPSAQQAFSKLLPRTHAGAIVLLHSTSATNAAILDELLTKWEEMGYTFGTLDELGAQPCAQGSPHVIALDAGHGGMDTGAAGPTDEVLMCEQTADALYALLEADANYTPVRCRENGQDAPIADRAARAGQAGACLLLSIHGNLDSSSQSHGFECYPTPPGRAYYEEASRFAQCIAQGMGSAGHRLRGETGVRFVYYQGKSKKIVDSSDTRVREEKSFGILEKAPCPAVLAEQCFLSNSGDYEAWATPQGCQHAAHVYYEAICRYFGTQPIAQA